MSEQDILAEARERFAASREASAADRLEAEADFRFARLGEQWEPAMRRARELEGRPALTINRLPAFIRQVVNDARQAKPGIRVSPVDSGADPDTAAVIGGLIRAIERHSRADEAYDTAIDHAVTGGFGFFRIAIDHAGPDSFDLEARIERIADPLKVHWDPDSTALDAADWAHAFVAESLPVESFRRRHPDAEPVDFDGDGRAAGDDGRVRISEYWRREHEQRSLLLARMPDGSLLTLPAERLEAWLDELHGLIGADPTGLVQVVRERKVEVPKVTRRLISGSAVLETADWPGSTIPICPVWGDETILDGRRRFRSLIRDARDPQKMFNFWRSATTELVALAPRAPWLMPAGALPQNGTERQKWGQANARSFAYLTYEGPVPPQRQPFAGVPAGAIQEALNAADDMKAITGIYDPALGARSNETSGRAILARQRESQVSNFHFLDNLNRAIRYAGQCLVEIIPAIYGPRQAVRILGEDMAEKVVALAGAGSGNGGGATGAAGRLYDLSVGRYDVTVRAGPSYQTQREEAREVLVELIRARPELAPVVGDVLLDNMDFAGAEVIAERLRRLLPAPLQQGQQGPVMPSPGPAQPGPAMPTGRAM